MLDNYGANIERIVRLKNANVNKIAYPQIVKDDFQRDRERKQDSFQGELNRAKDENIKKEIQIDATKQSLGGEVIVDSSLNKKINEHRVISQLVTEKFVNNPKLQGKIEFEVTTTLKDRIDELLNDNVDEKVVNLESNEEKITPTASEACLNEIEKVIKKLGEP